MRTIVKEPQFEDDLKRLKPDARRADEFIESIEWVLARDPTLGTCAASSPDVWFMPIADACANPSIAVYYTFDDIHVWLLSIQVSI